jgi:hypothetical protein
MDIRYLKTIYLSIFTHSFVVPKYGLGILKTFIYKVFFLFSGYDFLCGGSWDRNISLKEIKNYVKLLAGKEFAFIYKMIVIFNLFLCV